VHVDLHAISHDLHTTKDEIARRPTRGEILKLALGCVVAVVVALLLISNHASGPLSAVSDAEVPTAGAADN
jgi:hypothetical protein